jgi:circadian clock protein KaiC
MSVVKVRGSEHSNEIRAFEITRAGIVVGDVLRNYDGLLTGHPVENANPPPPQKSPRKRLKRS